MESLEIGIRIEPGHGVGYFGVEDLNRRIAAGQRVVEVRPGGVITTKSGEAEGQVQLTLSGVQFQVMLDDDPAPRE